MSLLKLTRSALKVCGTSLGPLARPLSTSGRLHCYWKDLYEPDYLASYEPDIPELPPMNIQLKGYDFSVLECYQKHVNKIAEVLDIDVDSSWATPPQILTIKRFKPLSAVVEHDYKLNVYERNLQITNAPSTRYAMLLRLVQETLPEGVSLEVMEATNDHQEKRYVPDLELLNLKQQLQDMGGVTKKKKK